LTDIAARVFLSEPMVVLRPPEPGDCVNGIEFSPNGVAGSRRERIDELDVHGSLFASDWMISLGEKHSDDPLETLLRGRSSRTFPICHDNESAGKTLTLGIAWPSFP